MNPKEIQDKLTAEPFRPFRMFFPSRTAYTVSSRDQALMMADGRTIAVPDLERGTSDIFDALMIERLEIVNETPKEPMWWIKSEPNGH